MRSYQVVEFGHTLRDTDMLDPKPTGDEVVIAVKAAGVCHSDLHIWEGGFDLGGGRKLTLKDRGVQLPLTLGHETAGEILSIGPNVTDRKVGEMCLVYPWIGCGVCRVCRDGHENLCMKPRCLGIHCDGGYSDQLVVPHWKYLLPLEGLDPVASAPLACSGVTTYSALKKLRAARLRQQASVEDVDYRAARGLDRALFQKLSTGEWIDAHDNLALVGPAGVGKSWLACAIGHRACRDNRSVLYHRWPKLCDDLALARGDGRHPRLIKALGRADLLILDDFGLEPLDAGARHDLLEILEERYGRRSTIVTSQLPLSAWHEVVGDPTYADAILDRLVHNAHRIELSGESLRRRGKPPKTA